MPIFGFNNESLLRHKVIQRECLEALADPHKEEAEMSESKNGNPKIIWLGMTMNNRLLEVGVEYLDEMDWVYHANSARVHFRKLYERK